MSGDGSSSRRCTRGHVNDLDDFGIVVIDMSGIAVDRHVRTRLHHDTLMMYEFVLAVSNRI